MLNHYKNDTIKLYNVWRETTEPRYTISKLKQWFLIEAGVKITFPELYNEFINDDEIYLNNIKFKIEIVDDNKFIHAKLKYL